jgi:hypothetical protein
MLQLIYTNLQALWQLLKISPIQRWNFQFYYVSLLKNIDKTKSKGACNWKKTWNGAKPSIQSYKDEALDIIHEFWECKKK